MLLAIVLMISYFGNSNQQLYAGFMAYDVTIPGETAEFDIVNLTGVNSYDGPYFPISTPLTFSSLTMTIHFTHGPSVEYLPTHPYFTPVEDGSLDGNVIVIGGTNPIPTGATLSGKISPTQNLELATGGTINISPNFIATIPIYSPNLTDSDFALIEITLE